MTYAIAKYRVTTFYKRRIVNVFLPFLVTAIVMAFVQHWSFSDFLKNTFFVNFYMDSIYSFLWFVPAIFTFYLLFPLYYKVFARTQSKVQITVCLLLIWVLVSVALRDIMRPDLYGFTNRIPVFIVGILAGWMLQNKNVIFTKNVTESLNVIIKGFLKAADGKQNTSSLLFLFGDRQINCC